MELKFILDAYITYDGSYYGQIIDAPEEFWDAVGRHNDLIDKHNVSNLPNSPGTFKCNMECWYTSSYEGLNNTDIEKWEFILLDYEKIGEYNGSEI